MFSFYSLVKHNLSITHHFDVSINKYDYVNGIISCFRSYLFQIKFLSKHFTYVSKFETILVITQMCVHCYIWQGVTRRDRIWPCLNSHRLCWNMHCSKGMPIVAQQQIDKYIHTYQNIKVSSGCMVGKYSSFTIQLV